MIFSGMFSSRTLVSFLRFEDSFRKYHEKVYGAHNKNSSPEPHNADNDGLKYKETFSSVRLEMLHLDNC